MKGLLRREWFPYALLVAAALVVRFIDLGDRPFHHDESQDAYFSWLFAEKGQYQYQPILHGPLRFYLTAGMYTLFGDSDFTARLAPALMGTILVGLPYFLRDQLGRLAAIAASVFLAFGPTFLYFGRFAREDIYMACLNMALLIFVFRFLEAPKRWHLAAVGGFLAAAMATKEATFITGFVAFTFLVGWLAYDALQKRRDLVGRLKAVGWEPYGWAFATWAIVFTLLFTVFLTKPHGLLDGLVDGLDYWLAEHGKGRGEKEWYFYIVVLIAHEWPMLLLGGVGAFMAFRRPTPLRLFLVWAFVLQLAIYCWANERFTWLVMHPLLPLILLAGIGLQAIWQSRDRWFGRLGLVAAAVGILYVGFASWQANVEHRADPREFLVTTQSSEQVLDVRDEVFAAADRLEARDQPARVTIDAAEGATYPYAWYFRHMTAGYPDLQAANATLPTDPIVVMTEASQAKFGAQLEQKGYRGRKFRFRVWWVRDYKLSKVFGGAPEWLLERKPWNETGGMWEWLYVKGT